MVYTDIDDWTYSKFYNFVKKDDSFSYFPHTCNLK